jgi:hypothetical protein
LRYVPGYAWPSRQSEEIQLKQIRQHLTYANVMSSVAVFLVLGGATALAATQLAKNSVGTKQLKKNAVTTAKIKKEAITNAKIKKGTITGASINLGALGTVPSATNAENLGGLPPSAYQPRVRWALVAPDGTVLRQSGGITVVDFGGIYELDFGANVSNSALAGNTVDNGTAGGPLSLMSCADSGAPGFGTCTATNPNVVKVVTTNAAGTITSRTFYLEVIG